ncbi:hypothetical protein LSAT2_032596 [Lamellibrachia satsuma]|nr:hypothetical protein LSAT2_032596 [Lamellibrachia satsuma]
MDQVEYSKSCRSCQIRGLLVVIPCIDHVVKVDRRTVSFDVPSHETGRRLSSSAFFGRRPFPPNSVCLETTRGTPQIQPSAYELWVQQSAEKEKASSRSPERTALKAGWSCSGCGWEVLVVDNNRHIDCMHISKCHRGSSELVVLKDGVIQRATVRRPGIH